LASYLTLPMLNQLFAHEAKVIMDDVDRAVEIAIAERWQWELTDIAPRAPRHRDRSCSGTKEANLELSSLTKLYCKRSSVGNPQKKWAQMIPSNPRPPANHIRQT